MVRDSFTCVTALADGQELLEEIPAEDADIPDFAERNLLRPARRGPTVAPTPEAVAAREAADAARLVSPRDAAIARLPANIDPASPAATELIDFLEEQSWPEAHTEYPVYLHGRSVTEHEAMLEASLQRMIARNAAAPPVDEEDDQEDGEVDEEEPDERDVTIDQLQSALRAREDTLTAVRAQLTALEASHGAVGAGVSRAGIPSLAAPALSPQPSRLPAMHYRNTVASLFDSGRLARHAPADAAAPQSAGLQEAGPQPAGVTLQEYITDFRNTITLCGTGCMNRALTVATFQRGLTPQLRGAVAKDLRSLPDPTLDDAVAAAIDNHKASIAAAGANAASNKRGGGSHAAAVRPQISAVRGSVTPFTPGRPGRAGGAGGAGTSRSHAAAASPPVPIVWCYHCGVTGHRSTECPDAHLTQEEAMRKNGNSGMYQALQAANQKLKSASGNKRPPNPALALVPAVAVLAVVEVVVVVAVLLVPPREELKKQIKDYLAKGMIEPSSSPYAAPILFVQKKSAGYHQIRITPEDVPKTAFRTPEGHFQFKVLSFGLTNAPATFQRVMNDAFAPVLGKCALVYLDDILVMSKSLPDHMQHLRLVFDLLRANKLFAKMSKCEFMQLTLKFLGHVITAGAISVDPDKSAVANVPMLRLPDHTQPFQVYCDASLQGVGAVLMQDGYPLAYLSKKLSSAEVNYTTGYRLDPAFNAEADLSSMYQDTHGLWRLTGKDKVVVPNDF
ncbi:hypothetical protein QJQ45_011157 [Haematococcus lacustris]|nr:hypothetical protein QJQ45_011157 [Haematococcus lacustris]